MKTLPLTFLFISVILIQAVIWGNASEPQLQESNRISLTPSSKIVVKPCPPGFTPRCDPEPSSSQQVNLSTGVSGQNVRSSDFIYSVTGGRLTGEGSNVTWDFSGVQPGTYTATVEVERIGFKSIQVEVRDCNCLLACPMITISCPDNVEDRNDDATVIFFTISDNLSEPATYNWMVSEGTIACGQGTSTIAVKTKGLGGKRVTATAIGGSPPECQPPAPCTTIVKAQPRTTGR